MPNQVNLGARLLLSLGVMLLGPGAIARAAPAPELILFHGRILTVDSRDSVAEALAVLDGKIVAVGSDEQILRLAGEATRRIDLHGRTATPGLIDSHAHIADARSRTALSRSSRRCLERRRGGAAGSGGDFAS